MSRREDAESPTFLFTMRKPASLRTCPKGSRFLVANNHRVANEGEIKKDDTEINCASYGSLIREKEETRAAVADEVCVCVHVCYCHRVK